MKRVIRLFVFYIVGLVLGGLSVFSYAETISATSNAVGTLTVPGTYVYNWSGNSYSTVSAACSAWRVSWNYSSCGTDYYDDINFKLICGRVSGTCGYVSPTGSGRTLSCPSGYSPQGGQCVNSSIVYTCPSVGNWTVTGTFCVRPDCLDGEVRDSNGICKPSYKTCAELVVTATGSCVRATSCGSASTTPLDVLLQTNAICSDQNNDNDCGASGGIVIGEFQGKPICLSPPPDDPSCTALGGTVVGTLNGQPICSASAGNPTCPDGSASAGTLNGQPVCTQSCPTGSAPGTVNGVTSCYPISSTTTKTTTQTSTGAPSTTTTTSNDPNVTTGTGTSSSTTICDGDNCTTKTQTTNPAGQTTTVTVNEPKSDFCSENPKAKVCSGSTEDEKYCTDNQDAVGCMKAGTPTEEGGLTSVEKGISTITPVTLSSSSVCPADIQLPRGATITYQGVCMYAEGLRPFVLISAWLLAGLIVLGMAPRG